MKLTNDAQQNRQLIEVAFTQLFDRMTHLEGRMDTIDMLLSGEYVLMKAVDSPHKDRLENIEEDIRDLQKWDEKVAKDQEETNTLLWAFKSFVEDLKQKIREEQQ
jgi:hypothetical protein